MKHLIYISIIGVLMMGCKTQKLNYEPKLATSVVQAKEERLISRINIPFTVNLADASNFINKSLPNNLYEDNDASIDNLKIKVGRLGDISLTGSNNKIQINVPLHIDLLAEYVMNACEICPNISVRKSQVLDVKVITTSTLSVNADWKLVSRTETSYEWISTPAIDLGIVKLPVTMLVNKILKPRMNEISAQIDKYLYSQIDIKTPINIAWKELHRPVTLDPDTKTILNMEPQNIQMSPISISNNIVSLNLGLESYLNISSGIDVRPSPLKVLPKLITTKAINDACQIAIYGTVSYDLATKLASQFLVNKTFTAEKKYNILVKSIKIYKKPDEANKMAMTLGIKGTVGKGLFKKKVNGLVFLEGTPYYDQIEGSIKIKNLDYSFDTKNALNKAAIWVLKIGFNKYIESYMVYPVKDQIDYAFNTISTRLEKKSKIGDYAEMYGTLNSLQPGTVYVNDGGINAVILAGGKVKIELLKP